MRTAHRAAFDTRVLMTAAIINELVSTLQLNWLKLSSLTCYSWQHGQYVMILNSIQVDQSTLYP